VTADSVISLDAILAGQSGEHADCVSLTTVPMSLAAIHSREDLRGRARSRHRERPGDPMVDGTIRGQRIERSDSCGEQGASLREAW